MKKLGVFFEIRAANSSLQKIFQAGDGYIHKKKEKNQIKIRKYEIKRKRREGRGYPHISVVR